MKAGWSSLLLFFFAVWFSFRSDDNQKLSRDGPSSYLLSSHRSLLFEFPLKPRSSTHTPTHTLSLFTAFAAPSLIFRRRKRHDTSTASVLSRWRCHMRGVWLVVVVFFFCFFFAAALQRQAGGTVRLLGSHITLPTRAVFPHKLNPIPRACLYKLWPSCLTVCGDLSGSSSHGSESHSRTWI